MDMSVKKKEKKEMKVRRFSHTTRATVMAVLLSVGVVAAACGSSKPAPKPVSKPTKGPIVIGAPVALSGYLSSIGQADAKLAKEYVAQINATGGVNGRKLKLIVMDTKSSITTGVLDVRKLITQDHVVALLGISGTTLGVDIEPIVKQYHVPTLADIGGGSFNHPAPPYFFKIPESAREVATLELAYLKKQGITKVAWANGNNGFSEEGYPVYKQVAKKYGMTILDDVSFSVSAANPPALAATAERLKSISGAQALIIYAIPPSDIFLQDELHAIGYTLPIYQNNAPATSTTLKAAPPKAIDGTILVGGNLQVYNQISPSDPQVPVIKAFVSLYGDTNRFAGDMYDAISLLVKAMKAVGTSGPAIEHYLNHDVKNYPGVTGMITFSPEVHDGISPASLDIMKIVNDKFKLVETGSQVLG
jgi:branched-chain amino acid transport system substrate-binding protein